MNSISQAINHPADAYRGGGGAAAWLPVLLTILFNSLLDPVLSHFFSINTPEISWLWCLKITVLGAASYAVICAVLWLITKLFGSRLSFSQHFNSWGMTYYPTALCGIAVAFSEVFFYVFWNGTVWGMLLSFLFVGILLWKLFLFVIYLRSYAGLKGWRFFGAFAVLCVIILALAFLSGKLGVKTPVL